MPARKATQRTKPQKPVLKDIRLVHKIIVHRIIFAFTILIIGAFSVSNIYAYKSRPRQIIVASTLATDLSFWQEMVAQNPTYRDAYIVIAQMKSRAGNEKEADALLQVAQEIDPFVNLNKTRYVLGQQTATSEKRTK